MPPSIVLPRARSSSYAHGLPRCSDLGTEQVGGELGQLLVGLRPHPLRQRSFGARLAVLLDRGQPAVRGEPQHLGLEMQLAELVGDHRIVEQAPVARLGEQAVEHLPQAHLEEEREPGALVHERRQRDLPAVALAPEQVRIGDPCLLDEQLVELRLAGDLTQRADLDVVLLHVHQEVAETLVLRRLGVGPRDEHAPLRVLGAARPHLLTGDDPLIAALDRARLQRREVRAGLRLREALTPDLIAGDDRREVAVLLLLGAPGHDRRTREQQSEHVRRQRRTGASELLEEDRRLRQRRAATAVLTRPVHRGPAATGQATLEVTAPAVVGVLLGRRVAGRVLAQPAAELLTELELLLVEGQVHCSSFPASRSAQPTSTSSRSIVGWPVRTRAQASS